MAAPEDPASRAAEGTVASGGSVAGTAVPAADGSQVDASDPGHVSLQAVLAAYDRELDAAFAAVDAATTGTERVRLLRQASRVLATHDAVLRHGLCPLLEDLRGGAPVASRLCAGVTARAELLEEFDTLTKGVAPHNVYPVSGDRVEALFEGLVESIRRHVDDETAEVAAAMERAASSVDPEVVAARLALAAARAPTRPHRLARLTRSSRILRLVDRFEDWVDAHHGWFDIGRQAPSPREVQATALKEAAATEQPTVSDVLAGYARTVHELVAAWASVRSPAERLAVARRLTAAITVHDSVLGGVLCPLVEAVPGAEAVASALRRGCMERAELLARLGRVLDGDAAPGDVEEMVDELVRRFHAHQAHGADEVTAVLDRLTDGEFRDLTSPLADAMWPWHSEGPAALALRMAVWAEKSPTKPHALVLRHPHSRVLRALFKGLDTVRDGWTETALGRWLAPRVPGPAPGPTPGPAPQDSGNVNE